MDKMYKMKELEKEISELHRQKNSISNKITSLTNEFIQLAKTSSTVLRTDIVDYIGDIKCLHIAIKLEGSSEYIFHKLYPEEITIENGVIDNIEIDYYDSDYTMDEIDLIDGVYYLTNRNKECKDSSKIDHFGFFGIILK